MKCRRCLGAVGVAFLLLVLLALIAGGTQARASASPRAAPAASWVVTNTADSGPGSLRQALLDAEDGDIISFDLGVFPPGSPATILLTSGALPQITRNNVTIDASNAGVILDGSNTPAGTSGLVIHGANHVTIKGLHVTGFPDSGIMIRNGATYNTIGGSNATPGGACSGDCNLLSGNGWYGVRIAGMGTMTNTVSGNYIGTDASGTVAQPNGKANGGYGVLIEADASLNIIGGDTVAERNLISGNGDLFCGPPSQA